MTSILEEMYEDWQMEDRKAFEAQAVPVMEAVSNLGDEWYSYDTGWQCNVCHGNGPGYRPTPGTGPDGYDHKDGCPVPAIETYRRTAGESAGGEDESENPPRDSEA